MNRNLLTIVLLVALASEAGAMIRPAMTAPVWKSPANTELKARIEKAYAGQVFYSPTANSLKIYNGSSFVPVERVILPKSSSVQRTIAVGEPQLYFLVVREAKKIGIDPIVMYAIEVHETGNFTSHKWRSWDNPGGIEFRHFDGIPCEREGRWAHFYSPEDGIKAHAEVLSHHRYDGARETNDPLKQVEAIGRGGYCEPGYNWVGQVKAHVRRLMQKFNNFVNRQYASR